MAGTLTAATIDSGAASTAPTFSANGTQIGTLCRAWCKFNGTLTGTNAPTAGFNVSSVTRASAGTYTINFTNAFADADYSVIKGVGDAGNFYLRGGTSTTSSVGISFANSTPAAADVTTAFVAIFR